MKKHIKFILISVFAGLVLFTPAAKAEGDNLEALQSQIQALLKQIEKLQAEVSALRGYSGATYVAPPRVFQMPTTRTVVDSDTVITSPSGVVTSPSEVVTSPSIRTRGPQNAPGRVICDLPPPRIRVGYRGEEVKNLQKVLNSSGFTVARTGFGSTGNETDYFGPLTKGALRRFQASEGITPTAELDGVTREKIMEKVKIYRIGCQPIQPRPIPGPVPVPNQGIVVLSPQPGQYISSPVQISGYVDKYKWGVFEGEAGSVSLFDSNGRKLGRSLLGVTNFSYDPNVRKLNFKTSIVFTSPQTKTGYLLFRAAGAKDGTAQSLFKVNVRFGSNPTPAPDGEIKVYSPASGESWQENRIYTIKWQQLAALAQGGPPGTVWPDTSKVKITLHSYHACLYSNPPCSIAERAPFEISSATENDGVFEWKIPAGLSKRYSGRVVIKVTTLGGNLTGRSGVFTISPEIVDDPGLNRPPVVSGVSGPTTLKTGEMGTWTVKAYDPENGSLSYSVVWEDELNGLGSTKVDFSLSQSATFTHVYNTPGSYTPVFTVTDDKGQSAMTSISVRVGGEVMDDSIRIISRPQADSNGNVSIRLGEQLVIEGKPSISGQLGFDYSRAFFFGPIFRGACSNSDWTMKCTAKEVGTSDFYIEVYKDGKVIRSNVIKVTVVQNPFVEDNSSPVIVNNANPVSGQTGQSVEFRFSAYDTDGDKLSWKISWGDGTVSAFSCSGLLPSCDIYPNHVWNSPGTYRVEAVVSDNRGGEDKKSFDLRVEEENQSPVIDRLTGLDIVNTGSLGNHWGAIASDPDGDKINFVINWGDGSAPTKMFQTGGAAGAGHVYTHAGSYKLLVEVDDGKGGYAQSSKVITVVDAIVNEDPVIEVFSGPTKTKVGNISFWEIKASDPDGDYIKCEINWGPRDDSSEFVAFFGDNLTGSITTIGGCTGTSHLFTVPGIFEIKLNVLDGKGGVAEILRTIEVEE